MLDYSGNITLKDVDRLLKRAGYGPLPKKRITIISYRIRGFSLGFHG